MGSGRVCPDRADFSPGCFSSRSLPITGNSSFILCVMKRAPGVSEKYWINNHCNWKLLIQNNTGTLLVPWEYVSPVCSSPCSCERSQRAQLRAPACARRRGTRACISSHRADIPIAGHRCEESSCFPLLFGGTPWVNTNPFQRPNAEYQGALQLLLFFHPNRSKDNLSQQGPLT